MLANFYDYSKIIGEGSFGKVYVGEHRITKKKVAIKQNNELEKFLLHESKIMRSLQTHKGVPKMIWYGRLDNKPTLIMELLEVSFRDIREKQQITNGKLINNIVQQVFDILEYIHSKNIIHRDIKPENLMFKTNKKDICLIDYGLARYYKINGKHVEFEKHLNVVGSYNYCGINVNKGVRPSRRDDIESMLYILLNMTSGMYPCNKNLTSLSVSEKNDYIYNYKTNLKYDGSNHFIQKNIRAIKYAQALKYDNDPDYGHVKSILKINNM